MSEISSSAEQIFQQNPVEVIQSMVVTAKQKANALDEQLQDLVGTRYRDLLTTSDVVGAMKAKSECLLTEIKDFKNTMNEISEYKQEWKFSESVSSKEITSLIFWTPETIWNYLDNNNCLDAAIHYLKAEKAHIASSSLLFLDENISNYNTQQWEYCLSLPHEIKNITYQLLKSHNLTSKTFVNCFATLLLMTGNSIEDILDICWKERENAIKLLFQSQNSLTPDDILSQLISGTSSLLSHTYYCIIHPLDNNNNNSNSANNNNNNNNNVTLLSVLIYICKQLNIKYESETMDEILPLVMNIRSSGGSGSSSSSSLNNNNGIGSSLLPTDILIEKSVSNLTKISNKISQNISDIIGKISSLKELGELRSKLSQEGTNEESIYEVMLNGQNYWGILFQTPFLLSSDSFLKGTFETLKSSITSKIGILKKSNKQKSYASISQYIENEITSLLKDSNSFITNKDSVEAKSILNDMERHLTGLLQWFKDAIIEYLNFCENKEANSYKLSCLISIEWCYSIINNSPTILSILGKENEIYQIYNELLQQTLNKWTTVTSMLISNSFNEDMIKYNWYDNNNDWKLTHSGWTTSLISEETESGEKVEDSLSTPLYPSLPVHTLISNTISTIYECTVPQLYRNLIDSIKVTLSNSIKPTYLEMNKQDIISDPALYQIAYDLSFLELTLDPTPSVLHTLYNQFVSKIDPIDWALYQPIFKKNIMSYIASTRLLFGLLADEHDIDTNITIPFQQDNCSIIPTSKQIPRLQLLPLALPK